MLGAFVGTLLLAACSEPAASVGSASRPVFGPDSAWVRVAAGAHYAQRSQWWQQLWGRHYRQLWATPVTAPVLRLGAAKLLPVQVGGSFQTNTLRLNTADGRTFVLRSVDKDLSRSLNTGMSRLVAPVLRDQTCAAPPYGAYIAAVLAEAAGVYHTNPRLVYLLPDTVLGDFRTQFQPALYLLEERPARNQTHAPSFGGSRLVTGSEQMLRTVLARPTARVAARAYLRARLLDILVGDWSRRADQWRWAAFATGSDLEFRPIPRDRDQAFFRFDDGWLTRALSWVRPRYQTFDAAPTLAQVDPLTVTARPLDETVLALLPEAVFRAEADSLARRLTDSVYAQALRTVPPEVRPLMTRELLPALRVRRSLLPAAAARYYRALQVDAAVIGTDAAERFVVEAAGPGRLRLQVWALRPARADSLLGEQLYDVALTRRLRIYGLGGNDQFELRGHLAPGFAVWLDGGAGTNRFVQQAPATSGLGVRVYAGAHDQRQLSTDVHVRPLPAASRDAASWVAAYYRLRLGSR
ncbi:hypothetical protein FNT36_00790 [Hymenobacter setariae]|uniref:Uncharacterized protein n=1 Tax=Hymenobacter setariae TaxID=2594794 RepID=A0A558C1H5_9BACT|nr:hypothetical protein [Hymenobacter setariae]TVT42660.1 hypothetical protein FNT36_00790 [Hymenobacter setariae]